MESIYDNKYDNPQLERLNEILHNMTDEELDRKIFEVECQCEGLDPNHPESLKRLKKIKRRQNWKYKVWPPIRNTMCWLNMIFLFFMSGVAYANDASLWYVIFLIGGGLGWFNIFLTHKFGSDYIFK